MDLFDEFKVLREDLSFQTIEFHWVKGHAGFLSNELADELSAEGIDSDRIFPSLDNEIDWSDLSLIGTHLKVADNIHKVMGRCSEDR